MPPIKQTRKEHIVPQMLLSRFVAPDGRLWVYTKGKPPRPSKPENECVERDFFEFELRGKKTQNGYENWLSQIEGDAVPVLEAIVLRRQISSRDAEVWATFVAALFGRTRKVRAQISEGMAQKFREQTENSNFVRELQYALLQRGELHYAEDLKRAIDERRAEMDASPSYYHVSALPNRVGIIAQSLLTRAWHTIEAPLDHCFLISDCPVVTYEVRDGRPYPGAGFGGENTAVLLPVGPKHLFVASPHHFKWNLVASPSGVRNINRLIVQFAHRNVYASFESEGVRALVDAEIDKILFGRNAFLPPSELREQSPATISS
jgi:Protein of unknown function (DUF4238)